MVEHEAWLRSELKREMDRLRALNVAPEGQSILYSGPHRDHGKHPLRNRKRAERYAAREGATTLEMTPRGRLLEERQITIRALATKMIGPYGAGKYVRKEWMDTSGDFAQSGHGHIQAFVAGAGKEDVFRSRELQHEIQNPKTQTINGIPRAKLQEMTEKHGDDYAYRAVALAGVRQEMQQAIRTGDRELISDALTQQQLYMHQKRLDRGEQLDLSPVAKERQMAILDQRAQRLAAIRQSTIRTEALQESKTYIDNRLQQGAVTPEQAIQMTDRARRTVQDPQKAYRLLELARLKTARDKAISGDEPDIQGINNYLNHKEQYKTDVRAMRQANEQQFLASNAAEKPVRRRHSQRLMAGYAKLRRDYRRGRVKNYAEAELNLEQQLQDQKRQELADLSKPRIQRTRTQVSSHRLQF